MSGRVVVGVDGSPESHAALAWAVAEARQRGATVEAVQAYQVPVFTDPVGVGTTTALEGSDELEQAAREGLDDAVAPYASDPKGPHVEAVLVADSPGRALVSRAEGAAMVVVGARGLGKVASLLLGSVSQYVANHAPCPVVIIPHHDD